MAVIPTVNGFLNTLLTLSESRYCWFGQVQTSYSIVVPNQTVRSFIVVNRFVFGSI